MSDQIIQLNQDLIHTELKDLVKNSVEETLNSLLDAEADRLVNAGVKIHSCRAGGGAGGYFCVWSELFYF